MTGDDWLIGNGGGEYQFGGDGDDYLDGGIGGYLLYADASNNIARGYAGVFGRGYGLDRITENYATASVVDSVRFGAGIAAAGVTFTRNGNALDVSILGTTDVLTVQDWYLGNQYHVEEFRFVDGSVVTDVQAQALVSAMAAFVPGSSFTVTPPSNEAMWARPADFAASALA